MIRSECEIVPVPDHRLGYAVRKGQIRFGVRVRVRVRIRFGVWVRVPVGHKCRFGLKLALAVADGL